MKEEYRTTYDFREGKIKSSGRSLGLLVSKWEEGVFPWGRHQIRAFSI